MSQAGRYSDDTFLPDIEKLTGDSGGPVGPDGSFNINIVGGSGVVVTGNPGTNTLTVDAVAAGLAWTRVVGTTVSMAVDNGYIPTNVALTTLTLPLTANVGDVMEIIGEGAGGWIVAQNAGQSIQFGNVLTTVGVGGSISSSNQFDGAKFVCRVANTTWAIVHNIGVLNVV